MNTEEKSAKIKELNSMIVDLKRNKPINIKRTIQKLQQQIDSILNDE